MLDYFSYLKILDKSDKNNIICSLRNKVTKFCRLVTVDIIDGWIYQLLETSKVSIP